MSEYKTVEFRSSDEFIEKKSKFIGYVMPVKTIEDALSFISEIKTKHWDATHNVSAYVLRENNIQRSSDDGEPSGTAGVPVLDVLLRENIVDTCVVVTRYFGGTLLGAGGLIRAYSHASKLAVEAGHIIKMAECIVFQTKVDYSFYDRFCSILSDFNANIESTEFADNITVAFSINQNSAKLLENMITEQSFGKCSLIETGRKYAKISE